MKYLTIGVSLLLLSGCEFPDTGIVESTAPPFINRATTTPNLLDVNHLAVLPGDLVDTTLTFTASAVTPEANSSVTYALFAPDGKMLLSGELRDNGTPPDKSAKDGEFTATDRLHILKQEVGSYSVQFQATSPSGYSSNTIVQSLTIKNSNNHRPFITNLTMPDTAHIPPQGDTTFVRITLAASDTEGLGDIVSVTLASRRPDSTSAGKFYLYDDGSSRLHTQFGAPMTSGDSAAGDGIYTIRIPLTKAPDPPETLPTYREFSFRATDRSGDLSNELTKRIQIVK